MLEQASQASNEHRSYRELRHCFVYSLCALAITSSMCYDICNVKLYSMVNAMNTYMNNPVCGGRMRQTFCNSYHTRFEYSEQIAIVLVYETVYYFVFLHFKPFVLFVVFLLYIRQLRRNFRTSKTKTTDYQICFFVVFFAPRK